MTQTLIRSAAHHHATWAIDAIVHRVATGRMLRCSTSSLWRVPARRATVPVPCASEDPRRGPPVRREGALRHSGGPPCVTLATAPNRDGALTHLGDAPIYVSIDVDVMDPAFAPGTGRPEAGGLSSRELLETLRGLASLNIVGADIVELAPTYDHAETTAIAGAHIAYELLALFVNEAGYPGSR
jgi:hypothetical protein